MQQNQILMLVGVFVLGMLVYHMLKGMCGCKVVEGMIAFDLPKIDVDNVRSQRDADYINQQTDLVCAEYDHGDCNKDDACMWNNNVCTVREVGDRFDRTVTSKQRASLDSFRLPGSCEGRAMLACKAAPSCAWSGTPNNGRCGTA
jgi:hypothetical protein